MPSTNADRPVRPSYSADQFAPLFAAEDRHFWFRSRNRCIAAALRPLVSPQEIHAVLEVGCGTGVVLARLQDLLPQALVVGMDLFQEGLVFARRRFAGALVRGDVFQLPFARPFDLVGAFDVIEHLDDDEEALRRFWQCIRPGGHVVLTVPAHRRLWSYFDEAARHRRRYEPGELRSALAAAGFTEVYVTPFMAGLMPLMWLKRRVIGERRLRLARASAGQQQAEAETDLDVNPVLNVGLTLLMRVDALLIARRLRVPFGTSLLAVAKRPDNGSPESSDA